LSTKIRRGDCSCRSSSGRATISLASDAEEALGILGDQEFDLFLLDIRLGEGRSGTELLHLLRDLEPTASVSAVALTTYGLKGDREALLAEGSTST
jgi:CheY-like chemotaxis protein